MTTLDPALLEQIRTELQDERATLRKELDSYGADPESGRVKRIAGIDENFADLGAATAERSEIYALIEKTRGRLQDVERALGRMDAGGYGVCERCGDPIPQARLEARPTSVRCIDCVGKS